MSVAENVTLVILASPCTLQGLNERVLTFSLSHEGVSAYTRLTKQDAKSLSKHGSAFLVLCVLSTIYSL